MSKYIKYKKQNLNRINNNIYKKKKKDGDVGEYEKQSIGNWGENWK